MTKFPRRKCNICGKTVVAWKMLKFIKKTSYSEKQIFFCWDCCQNMLAHFTKHNVIKPVSKKERMNWAKGVMKSKSTTLGATLSLIGRKDRQELNLNER